MARRKKTIKNPFEIYQTILREWAVEVSPDMQDELPREKLLDAMLRLFEKLGAAELRAPLNKEIMMQPVPWQHIKIYYPPLRNAMRWQWTALDIPTPSLLSFLAPHLLAMAALRWLAIWLRDPTPSQERLMATMDRDLNRIHIAVQKFNNLNLKS